MLKVTACKASACAKLIIKVVDMSKVVRDLTLFFIFITAVSDKHHILTLLDRNFSNMRARYLTEPILELFVSKSPLDDSS